MKVHIIQKAHFSLRARSFSRNSCNFSKLLSSYLRAEKYTCPRLAYTHAILRQVHRAVSSHAGIPIAAIVVTVMSLSPLLVATSSVENAVFSQCAGNNAPLREEEGRCRGPDLRKRIIPGRRKTIPIHKHPRKTSARIYIQIVVSASSIVSPLSLKAVFYWSFDFFLVDERERDGSSPSQSAFSSA